MSLFSRLFKPKTVVSAGASYQELVETVGLQLLAAREKRDDSLRHSARFGELLGLLWQEDREALKAVHAAFNSVEKLDQEFIAALGRRVRTLQPTLPRTPEGRYAAVVQALGDDIAAISLQVPETVFTAAETKLFVGILTVARILLPPELHQTVCEFLIASNRVRRNRLEGDDTLPYQELICENIYRFLASLAPETMPTFWAVLRDDAVSKEFWPALRRIRDINAVPYLLELLPAVQDEQGLSAMSLDGQQEVIQVLREIGDLHAVPVLLAMEGRLPPSVEKPGIQSAWDRALSQAWRERSDLARLAGQTARHILRSTGESETQIQRASGLPSQTGGTLLRPAPPQPGTTPLGEPPRSSDAQQSKKHTL